MIRPERAGAVRVAHLVPDLGRGGAQQRLVRMLEATDRNRCQSTILSLSSEMDLELSRRAELVAETRYLDRARRSRIRRLTEIAHALRTVNPDIVHTHRFALEYARAAPVRLPPLVHTMGNLPARDVPSPRLRRMHALALRGACTVAVSDLVASAARSEFGLTDVHTIPTGAPIEEAHQAAPVDWRGELDLGQGPIVISIGRLATQKDYGSLVRAMGSVRNRAASLVLVGEGPEHEYLSELIARLELQDRVHLVGPRIDPIACLAGADVFALTSRWEGSSNAILEAMAVGLPVVATAVGGTAELVDHEVTGVLVDSGDEPGLVGALEEILADSDRREAMGRAGLARAQARHGLSAMAERHIQLYERLAGRAV